ncbi:MAG: RluA family pseudouridine synthase [Bacilli bacterium]|nr:RluA family pseudouridine synthase [Bacilli bacterium]
MYRYLITETYEGYSLKEFLMCFHLSMSKINRIINEGKFLLNGKIDKNSCLKKDDELLIYKSVFNENSVLPIFQNIDILYEDEYILVVDKPRNIIIHSDQDEVTLDRIVAGYLKTCGQDSIPRHTYRLDKDTIGCMVYAKDPLTLSYLSKQVETKELKKVYTAIIDGIINDRSGTISSPISKNRHVNGKMVISKNGKPAITNYEVKKINKGRTLVDLFLETGRTHQIRVHMAHHLFPVVGDIIYGNKKGEELQLQASQVTFIHPMNKKRLTINVSHKISL